MEEQIFVDSQLASMSRDCFSDDQTLEGWSEFQRLLFSKLASLQNLILMHGRFSPRSLRGISCFPTSLKRLHIPIWNASTSTQYSAPRLTAKNVIWLLTFGVLSEGCLGFTISTSDFDFLSEHHQAFERSSNIKKLSLCFIFVYEEEDPRTWWGTSRERDMEFKSGNMKTEALSLLFQVVNGKWTGMLGILCPGCKSAKSWR